MATISAASQDLAVDVRTSLGILRGRVLPGGGRIWRGVEYAKALPFSRPDPPQAWDGIRECSEFAVAAQPLAKLFARDIRNPLRVNVRCPPCGAHQARGLPVLFFVHGGAFQHGSGHDPFIFCRDGRCPLVDQNGIVLVTVNYRLGALGFLALPEADKNIGLWDVLAALRWVRREIGSFGGDPENVTIIGESAGGMICGCMLAIPQARGLFRRAILMSGALSNAMGMAEAEHIAQRFTSFCRVEHSTTGVRSLPLSTLLRKQWLFSYAGFPVLPSWIFPSGGCGPMPFQPCVDGELLAKAPLEAVAEACSKDVIVGYNSEEWNVLLPPGPMGLRVPLREAYVLQHIVNHTGPEHLDLFEPHTLARDILSILRCAQPGVSNGLVLMRFYTAHILGIPSLNAARALSLGGAKVFHYTFNFDEGFLGAVHGAELPLVFGTWNDGLHWRAVTGALRRAGKAEAMAEVMQHSFCAFARSGCPGEEWALFAAPAGERTNWLDVPGPRPGPPDETLRQLRDIYSAHAQPRSSRRMWGMRARL